MCFKHALDAQQRTRRTSFFQCFCTISNHNIDAPDILGYNQGICLGLGNFQSIRLINYRVIATRNNALDAQAFFNVFYIISNQNIDAPIILGYNQGIF